MNFQFNPAQLSRPQRESLIEVLGVIESENDQEIEIRVVEFPSKFMVKLDDDIEMLLGWDVDKQIYAGLTKPEPEPKPESPNEPEAGKIKPFELPESQEDTVDLPKPEPELDLAPVIERAEALARALVNLSKHLNTEQRIEVWMKFCLVLTKELWK